jgi:hypothetical protein
MSRSPKGSSYFCSYTLNIVRNATLLVCSALTGLLSTASASAQLPPNQSVNRTVATHTSEDQLTPGAIDRRPVRV